MFFYGFHAGRLYHSSTLHICMHAIHKRTSVHKVSDASQYLFIIQKRPNLAQNWHFRPNIGIFGPFDLIPDKKTMRTSCLGGFSIMWVPKLLLTPTKIRIFGPKTSKFGPKYAFLVILGQILPFFAHFIQCLTKNQCEQGA